MVGHGVLRTHNGAEKRHPSGLIVRRPHAPTWNICFLFFRFFF